MPKSCQPCEIVPGGILGRPVPGSRGRGSCTALAVPLAPPVTTAPVSAFVLAESLLRLWSRHTRKIEEVRSSRRKLGRARAYLASPGCHEALGRTYLEILERSHARRLDDLRQLRREACEVGEMINALPVSSRSRRPWSDGEARPGLSRSNG
jgi:hypothetical protein